MGNDTGIGCDYGHKTRVRLAYISGGMAVFLGVLALIVAAGVLIMNLRDTHLKEGMKRIDTAIEKQEAQFHVPIQEHRDLQTETRENMKNWAEVQARIAAQSTIIEDVRGAVTRIETKVSQIQDRK